MSVERLLDFWNLFQFKNFLNALKPLLSATQFVQFANVQI